MSKRRTEVYDRTDEAYAAYRARCQLDFAEARARGWTALGWGTIGEPEIPMGVPPIGHPRRHDSETIAPEYGPQAIALPDYGSGEDGAYLHGEPPS